MIVIVPFLPPDVNHYVRHFVSRGKMCHVKTPEAVAFCQQMPYFVRGDFVTGKRFSISLRFRFGPSESYDVDNLSKCVLDGVAGAGAIRNPKGERLSDRHFKRLAVEILDSDEDRLLGQQTHITIEAIA